MIRQIGSIEVLNGGNEDETWVDEIARKRGRRTDGKRAPRKDCAYVKPVIEYEDIEEE